MPDDAPTVGLRIVDSLAAVDAAQWDACALAPGSAGNPFLSHRFLKALEDSKSVPAHRLAAPVSGGRIG